VADLNTTNFLEQLYAANKLSAAGAKRAEMASAQTGTSIERTLLEFGLVDEDTLFGELAVFLDLPFVTSTDIDPRLMRSLPLSADFLRRSEMIPVTENGDTVMFATSNPRAGEILQSIGYHLQSPVEMALAAPTVIKAALAFADKDPSQVGDAVSDEDVERLNALANDGPVIKLVNDIISEAATAGASDVHIEAEENEARVRFRIDGVLRPQRPIPQAQRAAVASRLKIMASLNISEKRRPQDGRAQISLRGRSIDIRLSTLPTQYGESIVLRLLDRSRVALDWQALGYDADRIAQIERVVNLPNGIFLVAGPTGSGKTTTLYTALAGLDADALKIVTVEDPIEYSLEGINQVQVEPQIDMGFARALRAILRQDPDVIMIGEIRDQETAEIAVRAALVGRLVLSTIHTNDAVSAVTRLSDLGVPPYLLADTLRGVLSQRLLRTNCVECQGTGCDICEGSGRKGRTVVSEFFELNSVTASAISASQSPEALHAVARAQGFTPMRVTAEVLVKGGKVALQEMIAVFSL
jgi:general secretion pathway protein E